MVTIIMSVISVGILTIIGVALLSAIFEGIQISSRSRNRRHNIILPPELTDRNRPLYIGQIQNFLN